MPTWRPDAIMGSRLNAVACDAALAGQRDLLFSSDERLDEAVQIGAGTSGATITRYLSNRHGHGICTPNPPAATWMAVVCLRPLGPHDLWRDGRHQWLGAQPVGGLSVFDLRSAWNSDLRDPFHTVNFCLPHASLDDLAAELHAPPIRQLAIADWGQTDAVMTHLAQALLPALTRPHEMNTLFVDHIVAAASLHLARTYGGLTPRTTPPHGGLAPWQERRATEMLAGDLRGASSVAALAEACGLSASHFLRAFRRSTGMTPHRWLMAQRIATARHLLTDTGQDLREIAQEAGFADQSHFTRVFSGAVGISPGAWRRLQTGRNRASPSGE